MSLDDLEPTPPKRTTLEPLNLEPLSVEELNGYIAQLTAEIERARAFIGSKQGLRGDAEALFKK